MHFIVKGVRLFFTALLCCDLRTMSSIGNRAVTVLRRLVGNLVGTTFVPGRGGTWGLHPPGSSEEVTAQNCEAIHHESLGYRRRRIHRQSCY